MLKANNVTKIYNEDNNGNSILAVNDITISVNAGEFIGIMGTSGSGKTTLLNVLSGLDRATKGKIVINHKVLGDLDDQKMALFRRKNMGFVFQDYNLLDSLTIEENILLPLILDKNDSNDVQIKLDNIMNILNINTLKSKFPYNISGGQQQRACIARAIINQPKILFADEPTGNLDSKTSRDVMNYFTKINHNLNTTILMVTHDAYAASYCNKIIFIIDGKIQKELVKQSDQKTFHDRIYTCLNEIGRAENELKKNI